MELRPYQQAAREAVENRWEQGDDSTLLSIPTGCGKTVIFAKIAEDRVRQGDRVLILAHRGELLDQAADKLHTATGLSCATEKAEQSCLGSWLRVAVGSVQTLMRPKRLAAFPRDYFGTIIIDEAHHAVSDSYGRILNHFDSAKVLGVTATPDRGDMRNLGSVFQSLAYEYSLTKAIREGYLVPIKALTVPLKMDLSGVGVQSGDFKPGDLDSALDPYLYQIADEMAKTCADRKTVVFLPLVKTSQKFRDILCSRGFRAAEVNGESPDRAEILAAFDRGEYNALRATGHAAYRADCLSVNHGQSCARSKYAALVQPDSSRARACFRQDRPPLLLDFCGTRRVCRPAHLVCETAEVAESMTESAAEQGGPVDILEAAEQAESDVVQQREESLAKQLAEMKSRKRRLVDLQL